MCFWRNNVRVQVKKKKEEERRVRSRRGGGGGERKKNKQLRVSPVNKACGSVIKS